MSSASGEAAKPRTRSDVAVYLLDTSVLVDVLNGKRDRRKALSGLVEAGHVLASCSVTVAEVFAGMHSSEADPTEELLDSLEFYELTPAVSRHAGRLKYGWARKGVTLSLSDVMIAATAIHYRLVPISDNKRHFPMPDLVLYELGVGI